jgi:transposase
MSWVRSLVLSQAAQEAVRLDYLAEVDRLVERVARFHAEILAAVEQLPAEVQRVVQGLQVLRGVALVSAVSAVAEVGQFSRFSTPRQLMAYSGLVPREHSSATAVRRGGITKTGNAHLRRVVVEAAWHYRHAPFVRPQLKRRQVGQPASICTTAFKAQQRLHMRYRRLLGRGKNIQQTMTAIARELLGFMWAIAINLESTAATRAA